MGETIKISIRCGKKDRDIILLGTKYHLANMVRQAIDYYYGKTADKIPLPPLGSNNEHIKDTAFFTIVLNSDDSKDAIELLKTIPSGYRSEAIKNLLRCAMERCDLRGLMLNECVRKSKEHQAAQTSHNAECVPKNFKNTYSNSNKTTQQNQAQGRNYDDDIFAGI